MNDRCGWMREGGDMQCVYSAGHSGLHEWGALPAWALIDDKDDSDNEEGLQEMPQMPRNCRCQIQGEPTLEEIHQRFPETLIEPEVEFATADAIAEQKEKA